MFLHLFIYYILSNKAFLLVFNEEEFRGDIFVVLLLLSLYVSRTRTPNSPYLHATENVCVSLRMV